ncbi:MAG: CaiB/BaiF CoA-transferase family protein [Thermodesulfobacteriota bacterium]
MQQALSFLKVLDLSSNLPGPYMTWLLASMGADVVKVENPLGGDNSRSLGGGYSGELSPPFEAVNRNKRSVTLNLKHPQGRDLFLRLLDRYDVLVEGFRPGTMDRLGLSYEVLTARQPALIQVAISGYGQDGPNRLRAGHDVNYLSLAGILGMTGSKDGVPAIPGVQVADIAGGSLPALAGLLAALIQRQLTGKGQFVDVSMFHGVLSLATMVMSGVARGLEEPLPGKMLLNGRFPCYGLYRTKDGRYMSLGALEFKFWENFCHAVCRDDLIQGQFGGPEVVRAVEEIFLGRTMQEWGAHLAEQDCCCEPVLTLIEAADSELVSFRGMLDTMPHGGRQLTSPLQLSGSPNSDGRPSPGLGEHTREVLGSLGLTAEELERLARDSVI